MRPSLFKILIYVLFALLFKYLIFKDGFWWLEAAVAVWLFFAEIYIFFFKRQPAPEPK